MRKKINPGILIHYQRIHTSFDYLCSDGIFSKVFPLFEALSDIIELSFMQFKDISSLENILDEIQKNPAVIVYFSAPHCSVCKVIKPKLLHLLDYKFPKFELLYVNIEDSALVAGQFRIFSIPTLLVYFEGKEFYRLSRNISLEELGTTIERPYTLLFSD